ncbi:uncharacterized protein LOC143180077 [Calliopsis andreniformis]|uniref:uncharacterized protein LOC143180077 n=1 Tax=Calliopsis andreniformis TaxID=337506 RepID=UPI003FCDDBCB
MKILFYLYLRFLLFNNSSSNDIVTTHFFTRSAPLRQMAVLSPVIYALQATCRTPKKYVPVEFVKMSSIAICGRHKLGVSRGHSARSHRLLTKWALNELPEGNPGAKKSYTAETPPPINQLS